MNVEQKEELLQWAEARVRLLFREEGDADDITIERKDLQGALIRLKRTNRPESKQNCFRRIHRWHSEREVYLAEIKAEPGLVALFLNGAG
jgi:hypothetical protein